MEEVDQKDFGVHVSSDVYLPLISSSSYLHIKYSLTAFTILGP